MLTTTMKKENGELVISLEGQLNALTSQGFEKELKEAIADVQNLILDVQKLDYISSAGLRAILAAQQYMEDNDLPDVKVINFNENVREIFAVTGFDKMVNVESM